MIRIIVLLTFFMIGGCCSYDCNKVPEYFDVTGFRSSIQKITETYPDGTYLCVPLDSVNAVAFDKVVLQMEPTMTFYGDNSRKYNFEIPSFFVNSAVACECLEPGHAGSNERISEINIFSTYLFTSTGSTTDTLTKYFDIVGYYSDGRNLNRTDLNSFLQSNPPALKFMQLILKVKPNGSLKQQFNVVYKQTNGELYNSAMAALVILP